MGSSVFGWPAHICIRSGFKAVVALPRSYATTSYEVFDRRAKSLQKDRSARDVETSRQADYLRDEAALRMAERLAFISRTFPRVLDLGSGPGNIVRIIADKSTADSELIKSRLGTEELTMVDSSRAMLFRDVDHSFNSQFNNITRVVADEESILSHFKPSSFDAVLSSMSLHWINDLPGILNAIQQILVPDGMFMACMIGGDSLFELRTSLQLAEQERWGRITPRLSPLADVRDMGGLMQQAKFNLLTIDVDDIIVSYPDMFALLEDLQSMGESNAVRMRQPSIPKDVLMAANSIYSTMHGNDDGTIPATFRLIYMIGWKPSENQPKPLKRGSGEVSMKDVL
jgi:NADH dehydrogenase [ubiquinone] 1 alpha subcomplex assembly factor 5